MTWITALMLAGLLVNSGKGQCLQGNTAYLDIRPQSSEKTLGRVTRNSLARNGGFTLTNSSNTADWLQVQRWDTCNGNPNLLRIEDSPNPELTYMSLVYGVDACTEGNATLSGGGWLVFVASDGENTAAYAKPTQVKQLLGGANWFTMANYTYCGETMIWDYSNNVLSPRWKNPDGSLLPLQFFYWGSPENYMLAATSSTNLAWEPVDLVLVSKDITPNRNKTPIGIIVGSSVGGLVVLIVLCFGCLCGWKYWQKRNGLQSAKQVNDSLPHPAVGEPSATPAILVGQASMPQKTGT